MFAWLLSIRGIAIAGTLALAIGFGGGWKARDWQADAASASVQLALAQGKVKALEENLALVQKVMEADQLQAAVDEKRLKEMERIANELRTKISSGECLSAPDIERLRDFFEKSSD